MTRLPNLAAALSNRRLGAASTLLVAAALLAACGDAAPTAPRLRASAATAGATAAVTQVTVSSTSCATIPGANAAWRELKVPAVSGTYSDANVTVTLAMSGRYFNWSVASEKTNGIDAVLGRAAPSASLYRYDPPAELTHDEHLSGPTNKTRPSAPPAQLRSVIFCYDVEPTTAVVSGVAYHDVDGDGQSHEEGVVVPPWEENGIGSVTMFVDYDDDGALDVTEPSAQSTNVAGAFTITNVRAGTWRVRTLGPGNGWVCAYPAPCSRQLTLLAGGTSAGNDFGFWSYGSLEGWVGSLDGPAPSPWTMYADYNDNDALDQGEPSVSGSSFLLEGIRPGTWKIRLVMQSGWECVSPAPCYYEKFFYSDADFGAGEFLVHKIPPSD